MIYYFLPDPGIHGGIKVACQFVDFLKRLDADAVAVLPHGAAPGWFQSTTPIIDERLANNFELYRERNFESAIF